MESSSSNRLQMAPMEDEQAAYRNCHACKAWQWLKRPCRLRAAVTKRGALLAGVSRLKLVSNGTIVDATIISAPSSTKNKDGKRDPEMHQVAKGQQWYFGMKAHIAVDSKSKLIHTVLVSAANVADALALPHLLHGHETRVWGDQAYRGQKRAMRAVAPRARDFTNQHYRWGGRIDEQIKATNRSKSRVRAKIEHTIGVIKRVFGFQKVCYRGLAKNLHRLEVTAALANLYTVRRRLLAT